MNFTSDALQKFVVTKHTYIPTTVGITQHYANASEKEGQPYCYSFGPQQLDLFLSFYTSINIIILECPTFMLSKFTH